MNTPILSQLASVSPAPPAPNRGGEASEPGTRESFGQVMARVGAEAKPRAETTNPKHDDAKRDAERSESSDAAQAGEAQRRTRVQASAEKEDAVDDEADTSSPKTPAGDASDDADSVASEDAAVSVNQLIDALHLPSAAVAVAAVEVDVASAQSAGLEGVSAQSKAPEIVSVPATAPEPVQQSAVEPAVVATTASSGQGSQALADRAAQVAQPAVIDAKALDGPPRALGKQTIAPAAQQDAPLDAAAPNDETTDVADRAPAIQPNLLAGDRKAPREENRSPPADKAPPQRAPIAEALAALGAKQAEGNSATAKVSASEHNFDQLLASRALAVPRAEQATQAVPFANLLATQTTTTPAAVVFTPVDQPGFAQDFGNRVLLLATGHVKSAELALTPADLGPVRVNIEVRGQDASISFVAAAAATRAALEDALPRLREMFAQQGLNLLDASVGAQVGQQGHRAYGRPQAVRGSGRNDGETTLAIDASAGIRPAGSGRPVRLIDVIA